MFFIEVPYLWQRRRPLCGQCCVWGVSRWTLWVCPPQSAACTCCTRKVFFKKPVVCGASAFQRWLSWFILHRVVPISCMVYRAECKYLLVIKIVWRPQFFTWFLATTVFLLLSCIFRLKNIYKEHLSVNDRLKIKQILTNRSVILSHSDPDPAFHVNADPIFHVAKLNSHLLQRSFFTFQQSSTDTPQKMYLFRKF